MSYVKPLRVISMHDGEQLFGVPIAWRIKRFEVEATKQIPAQLQLKTPEREPWTWKNWKQLVFQYVRPTSFIWRWSSSSSSRKCCHEARLYWIEDLHKLPADVAAQIIIKFNMFMAKMCACAWCRCCCCCYYCIDLPQSCLYLHYKGILSVASLKQWLCHWTDLIEQQFNCNFDGHPPMDTLEKKKLFLFDATCMKSYLKESSLNQEIFASLQSNRFQPGTTKYLIRFIRLNIKHILFCDCKNIFNRPCVG